MSYYELKPDVYRIQAGVGSDGEIFGAIFLVDKPGILIGCSGGMDFVKSLGALIDELDFENKIRVYLPSVTFNEIYTANLVKRRFPDIVFYVHTSVVKEFKHPEDNFAKNRYFVNDDITKYMRKNLPVEIEDVIGFDKTGSFETAKTKILIIPFSGPHRGHSFIYSRDHKLLCAGLILGRTSNAMTYYIDLSGSFQQYESALGFLEKAQSDIIFSAYDEPEFTSNFGYKVENVRDAIKTDRERILDICTLKYKKLDAITESYISLYSEKYITDPYQIVDIQKTKVKKHLDQLVTEKKLIQKEDQYRLNT